MADGTIEQSELITKIKAIYDELVILKVKPENLNLLNLDYLALQEEFEAVSEQLKTRKRFLGINDLPIFDENKVTAIYADGGVIMKNPSAIGGTWAWCGVNALNNRIIEKYGAIPAPPSRPVTNNHTEQIAITMALESMPDNWSGTVYSDSQTAIGRVFYGWKESNLPRNISERSKAALSRMGEIKTVLLQGHPTKADLERGIGKKRNLPVSPHNVWCDKACGLASKEFLNSLDITKGFNVANAG